jgi:hypothetical protein
MNAETQSNMASDDNPQSSQVDPDTIYTAFSAAAAALPKGAVAGADALVADIVASCLPEAVFRALATAIATATGFDRDCYFKQMRKGRAATENDRDNAARPSHPLMTDPDPSENPSSLDATLNGIRKIFHRQVVADESIYDAVTLWVAATHGYLAADWFPRFILTSPTPRCGKSTLMETAAAFVSRPLRVDNVSPAAVFRVVEQQHPTLLADEMDASMTNELRGIFNSGAARGGCVLRCEPTDDKSFEPVSFSTFCPVMLSGIGNMPGSVRDRSIIAKMQRAGCRGTQGRPRPLRSARLHRVRETIVPHLVAWAPRITNAIAAGVTTFPPELHDRAQDGWESLIAVADLAGGSWPARARAAAVWLSGGQDAPSIREILLSDIRQIIHAARAKAVDEWKAWQKGGRKGVRPRVVRKIGSTNLVHELRNLEHRPWAEFGRDRLGLTVNRLASLLKPFGLEPVAARVPLSNVYGVQNSATKVVRTYPVADLRSVFRQYL